MVYMHMKCTSWAAERCILAQATQCSNLRVQHSQLRPISLVHCLNAPTTHILQSNGPRIWRIESSSSADNLHRSSSSPPPTHSSSSPPPPACLAQPHFTLMLGELAIWKDKYFTTIVPRSVHDAGELGEWTAAMRKLHRRGALPPWAKTELSSLGMQWDVDVVNAKWHANFHLAREFKEAHGGDACDLNTQLQVDYEDAERTDWVEASRWLHRQRELYKGQKLTDMRLKLLKSVLGVKLERPYARRRRKQHAVIVSSNKDFQEELERRSQKQAA